MRYTIAISILVASVLAFMPVSSHAGQGKGGGASADRARQVDHDRTYDRDRLQDRTRLDVPDRDRDMDKQQDRDQDRIHMQDPSTIKDSEIYGSGLMTGAELNQYRDQLKKATTEQARGQFQTQHEAQMQERALKQSKELVPPGQGPIYGGELMSVQERNEFHEQLRLHDSEEGRGQFEAQHREKMQQRAKALGLEIEDAG